MKSSHGAEDHSTIMMREWIQTLLSKLTTLTERELELFVTNAKLKKKNTMPENVEKQPTQREE